MRHVGYLSSWSRDQTYMPCIGRQSFCLFILVALGLWRRLLRVPWTARRSRSWNSSALATWWEELTHWKRPWCWERLKAGGEGVDRGWDGWMASPTRWTWVWASSGSWWWTGRPGVLRSMGSQRVGHDWATELHLGLRRCVRAFSSWGEREQLATAAWASPCGVPLMQSPGSRALELQESQCTGLHALWPVGSSQTRNRTPVPCVGRQISIHWTPREAPITFSEEKSCINSLTLLISKVWSKPKETFYLNSVLSIYISICLFCIQACWFGSTQYPWQPLLQLKN